MALTSVVYFDPVRDRASPRRLTVLTEVASAMVRAGVAAAVDPAETATLLVGGALDSGSLIAFMLVHGADNRTTRIMLPTSVAQVAVQAGAGAPVDVQLPSPVGGLTATVFPASTVDYSWHVNTATLTFLGGNASFVGSVTQDVLTVTSGTPPTIGHIVTGGGLDKYRRVVSANGGGQYTLSGPISRDVPPGTTLTASGDKVLLSMTEKNGGPAWTAAAASAPIVEVDEAGRKYIAQGDITNPSSSFMDSSISGLDTSASIWFAAFRHLALGGGALINHGTGNKLALGVEKNTYNPVVSGYGGDKVVPFAEPKRARLFACANLQVMGMATYQGQQRHYLNETAHTVSGLYHPQNLDTAARMGTDNAGGNNGIVGHIYEIAYRGSGLTSGNFATLGDAMQTAMTANWKTVAFTDSILCGADSRGNENRHSGICYAEMASRPLTGVPATTRVINCSFSGGTENNLMELIARAWSVSDVSMKLPGKNTLILGPSGVNSCVTDNLWPSSVAGTGGTNGGTTARGDEVFNGTALTTAWVGSLNAGGIVVESGTIRRGAIFKDGLPTGSFTLDAPNVATTPRGAGTYDYFAFIGSGTTYPSGTAFTLVWGSRKAVIQTALAKGFYVGNGIEFGKASGDAAQERFRVHQRSDLLSEVLAGPGQTYDGKVKIVDFTKIKVGGVEVFGEGLVNPSAYFRDGITHISDFGQPLVFSGADTPQFGFKALVA